MRDRRAEIVEAAATLMGTHGYAQTSVDEVIKDAGLCGKGHFYHHFKSKEELGYAVLKREFDRFADYGLALLRDPREAPLDRVSMFIDEVVSNQENCDCARGCPFGNLAAEMADSHEGFRRELQLVFARWAGQLEAVLFEGRSDLGEGVDVSRLAQFIIATLEGAMLVGRVQRKFEAMSEIAEDLKRFISMHRRVSHPAGVNEVD
jgi:TetR/AcrR family transcriptional repressor of nem operon